MSYTQAGLPFRDGSQASYRGAVHAARRRGEKMRRLLRAYDDAGALGLTDAEAAIAAHLPVQSVCSLRNAAKDCGLVEKHGERPGAWGVHVTVWRLTTAGRVTAAEGA
jgi:hypothetical protein